MNSTIMARISGGSFVLIAEMGVNYYDIAIKLGITTMEAAKRMIAAAKAAGIHAVKFQTYKACALAAKDSPSYWDIREEPATSQHELFSRYDAFGYADYAELRAYCEAQGIEFLSTPFDFESADYLDSMMNVYKISSSDLNNLPFIAHIAKKNKPIILSAGASNLDEIKSALDTIRKLNGQPVMLMHCVLEYPTPYAHANLNKICALRQEFPDIIIGYSDHTRPDAHFTVIKTAYLLGARVVEKHFTLDKTLKGNDHYHAMDPSDAKNILKEIDFIDQLRGSGELKCLETEALARKNARRSLVSARAIAAGEVISAEMLSFKRPGTGIPPDSIQGVIGTIAAADIPEDTTLQWSMLKQHGL